ncbi:uncharacterized protein [Panulirus ornatus]|uniref:uncharacterized protein n=1 Tax=Panulirus ornatus TaxID=150431 RepID=UPI003A864DB0
MDVHCGPRVSASGAGGVQQGEATEKLTASYSVGCGRRLADLHGKLEQTGSSISVECRRSAASREAYLASLLTEWELAIQEERPASRLAQDYSRTGDDRQDRVAGPTLRDGGHSNDAPSRRRHWRDDAPPPPAGVWHGGSCCSAVYGGTKATTSSEACVVQPTTRLPEGLRSASLYDAPRYNAPAVPSCRGLLTATCRNSSSAGVDKLARTRGEASHRRAVTTYPTKAPPEWHRRDTPQWKHCCSTPEPREELQVDFLFDLSLLVDWQDAIPLVAIDVVSGVHIVIPVALARCNPIPWDVLLGEDKSSNPLEPCGRQSRVVHCRLTRLSSPPPIRCSEVVEKRVRPPLLQAADGQSQAKCCRFSSAIADYGGRPARSSSSSTSSSCERLGQRAIGQAQETHTLDTSSSSGTYGLSSSSTSRTVGVGSRSLSSSDEGTITASSGTERERLSASSLAAYPAVDRRRRTAFWVQETNLLNEERGRGPVTCVVCRRALRDVEEVVRHHQRRHRGLAKCPLCPARLHPSATSVHLRRHYLARVTTSSRVLCRSRRGKRDGGCDPSHRQWCTADGAAVVGKNVRVPSPTV